MGDDAETQGRWRGALTEPGFAPQARLFRRLPSNPRCPICRAPYRILREAEVPIGIGLNTGLAFTGFLGPTDEVSGFSAVGDAVNVAHRLGEAAGAGELMIGGDELSFAEPPAPGPGGTWEQRELQVKGREEAVRAWSLRRQPAAAA